MIRWYLPRLGRQRTFCKITTLLVISAVEELSSWISGIWRYDTSLSRTQARKLIHRRILKLMNRQWIFRSLNQPRLIMVTQSSVEVVREEPWLSTQLRKNLLDSFHKSRRKNTTGWLTCLLASAKSAPSPVWARLSCRQSQCQSWIYQLIIK